jgi:hypothetical protein
MSDGHLLILVSGDSQALRVIAAWSAGGYRLEQLDDKEVIRSISELAAVSVGSAPTLLRRGVAAGCIVDGGISDIASKMLQTKVGVGLSSTTKKGRR